MKHGLDKRGIQAGAERNTPFGRFARWFELPRAPKYSDAALIEITMAMIKTASGKPITEREPALYRVTKHTNEPGVRFRGKHFRRIGGRIVPEICVSMLLHEKAQALAPTACPQAASEGQREQTADARRFHYRDALFTSSRRSPAVFRRCGERQPSTPRVAGTESGRSLSSRAERASLPIPQREVGTNNACGARSYGIVFGLPNSGFVSPLTAPVPIPSGLDLFGICLAVLGLSRRYAAARRSAAAAFLED